MGRYLPQLDGLRAVAVLLVIAAHTNLIPGGYVGVDIFFVLSGFLITTILITAEEAGESSLRSFYGGRIRRLYPGLLLMLIVTLPIDGLIVPGSASHRAAVVLVSASYVANFWNLHPTHWMGGLGHTWSLAVEEQFYLLWPLLLPLVLRNHRGSRLLVVATLAMLGILAFGSPVFGRLLLGRGGVILTGCLLALALRDRSVPAPATIALAGAIAVVLVITAAPPGLGPDAGLASTAIALPCAMLIGGLLEYGILTRWLSTGPMVWLGRRSYGMYLWHFPILWVLVYGHVVPQQERLVLAACVTGLTIMASALSHRFVEMPFRTMSIRPETV